MFFNILLILINILVLAVIYIILRRRIDTLTDTERYSQSLTGELDLILSEINQATERNILVIEDKINELEQIIETAEQRIKLLKKSLKQNNHENSTETAGKSAKAAEDVQLEFSGTELTYNHLNRMTKMSKMVTPLIVEDRSDEKSESVKDRVIEHYKSGIDSNIIASSTGINRGEVELIISLYKQMHGQD